MAFVAKIITDYDNRGVTKAKAGFTGMAKSAIKSRLAVAALAASFAHLSKTAMTAFVEDDAAMQRLNKLLTNTGFAAQTAQVTDFISQLESASGVLDDELRPAFERLFLATKNVTVAETLMTRAMDIAKGTGADYQTVAIAISKALLGQRRGLLALNTGIDATTLKTGTMTEVLAALDKQFSGASAAAVETYLGRWQKMKVELENMKETFGGWLTDIAVKAFDVFSAIGDQFVALVNRINRTVPTLPTSRMDWGVRTGWKAARPQSPAERSAVQKKEQTFAQWMAAWDKQQAATAKKAASDKAAADKKRAAALAKELALKKRMAKYDLELINLEAAKKRAGSKDTMGRLLDLQSIALGQQGLTAGQAGMTTNNQVTQNFITTVQGSVVTQQELTSILAQELALAQQRNGYGKWGGGL